jgi:hypothetical protein
LVTQHRRSNELREIGKILRHPSNVPRAPGAVHSPDSVGEPFSRAVSWQEVMMQSLMIPRPSATARAGSPLIAVVALVGALLATGCADRTPFEAEPPLADDPGVPQDAETFGGSSEYLCYTAVRRADGGFRVRKVAIDYPGGMMRAAAGEYHRFRYRRTRTGDGVLVRMANCWVPAAIGASAYALAQLLKDDPVFAGNQQAAGSPYRLSQARGVVSRVTSEDLGDKGCEKIVDPETGDESWLCHGDAIIVDPPDDDDDGWDACETYPQMCEPPPPGGGGGGGGGGESAVAILQCNGGTRGSTVSCSVTKDPEWAHLDVLHWTFAGGSFHVTNPTADHSWSGIGVVGGWVTAEIVLDGTPATLSRQLYVEPRSWSWIGQLSTGRAQPGQYDDCMDPGNAGRVVGASCSASNRYALFSPASMTEGYTLEQVGSGPNKGTWYVASASTGMHLRSQINRAYREDGDSFPVTGVQQVVDACASRYGTPIPHQNNHGVNTGCTQTAGFSGLVSTVWNHEDRHMSAALSAAEDASLDLYNAWEPLVGESREGLQIEVINSLADIHSSLYSHAVSTHTGDDVTFEMWLYSVIDAKWKWSAVTVKD